MPRFPGTVPVPCLSVLSTKSQPRVRWNQGPTVIQLAIALDGESSPRKQATRSPPTPLRDIFLFDGDIIFLEGGWFSTGKISQRVSTSRSMKQEKTCLLKWDHLCFEYSKPTEYMRVDTMSSVCCLTGLQIGIMRIKPNPPTLESKSFRVSCVPWESLSSIPRQGQLPLSTWARTGISLGFNGNDCLCYKTITAFIYTFSYGFSFHQLLSCIIDKTVSSHLIDSFDFPQGCQLEEAMALHSSTLAWEIPWTEEPDGLQSMGSRRVRHDWATSLSRIGEGNGNPLQCSCLENPRDGSLVGCHLWGRTESDTTEVT